MDKIITWLLQNPTLPIVTGSAIIAIIAYKTQVNLAKVKHSIDFQNGYHDSEEFMEALEKLKEYLKCKGDDLEKKFQVPENRKNIIVVLNLWERASIAIKKEIYDEEVLYLVYGSTVIYLWNKLRPFIKERQKSNPRIFINFDWLAVRWIARRGEKVSKSKLVKLEKVQKLLADLD